MLDICEDPIEITLTDYLTNQTISLSDYQGKVILLSFMCIRCSMCWYWIQRMQQIQSDYETNNNVQIIGVMYNYNDASDGTHEGPVTSDWITEKMEAEGITISFPLLMDTSWTGSYSQQYLYGLTGPSIGLPWTYIISQSYRITNKWHRLSTSNGESLSFNSGDYSDTEYFVRHRLDDLQNQRTPWDTVLVLDYSGSMNSSVTIEGITQPKIDFLKEAANTLLRVWKDYALCEDRISLVYFNYNAIADNTLYPILPGANIENLIDDITIQGADGCTAMGAGLATGLDILEASVNHRYVILFTDGMQNRNPLVYVAEIHYDDIATCYERHIDNIGREDYPEPLISLCGPNGGQSDYSGTLPVILEGLNIPIHTIGIGSPASWMFMLENVSAATFGESRTDSEIWPNLKEFFLETLIEIYRGSSIQMVTKKQGTLEDQQDTEVFLLNKSVKKMTVILSWMGQEVPLILKLKKNGREIDLSNKLTFEQNYCFATLTFPHYQKYGLTISTIEKAIPFMRNAPIDRRLIRSHLAPIYGEELIGPEGNWEIVIERTFSNDQASVPYHIMVLVDDKLLEYELVIPKGIHYAGEIIPINLRILEEGIPIQTVYSADLAFRRPLQSLGTILSKYKEKGEMPKGRGVIKDYDSSPLAKKVEMLFHDDDMIEKLRESELDIRRIKPTFEKRMSKGKGPIRLYRDYYEKTEVPGVYKVDLLIKGFGRKCGAFERIESHTFFVLAKPDRETSDFKGIFKEKEGQVSITVIPKDKLGNLVGPGYSNMLRFRIDGKRIGRVVDNLDGSYEILYDTEKIESLNQAKVEFDILDVKLFEGKFDDLVKLRKGGAKKTSETE